MEIIPQLDVTTYSSQLFWFFLSFIFLYLMLSKLVIPKIEEIKKGRSAFIEKNIILSNEILSLSEYEVKNSREKLARAHNKSIHAIESVFKEVQEMKETIPHILNQECDKIYKASNQEINNIKRDFHDNMINFSVEIASLYYKKLFNAELNSKDKLFHIAKLLYKKNL